MTTVNDIVTKAFQKVGILTKTEVISADEMLDGIDTLNAMLSSWSNDSMMVNARTRDDVSLISGVSTYTIGTGQTFNTVRPTFINDAYVTIGSTDYPLTVITDEIYDDIAIKSISGIPEYINYDNAYPVGKIRIYPVPSANYTLHIVSEKPLSQFSINSNVDLPAGWEQALIYNLALLIAPEYNQPLDQVILKIASDSKASIQRAIMRNRTLDAQPNAGNSNNIYSGWNS